MRQFRSAPSVGPAGDDNRHALRVAAGLFAPGIVLVATGHSEQLGYAVFGSFTGMYGRADAPWQRLRHQAQAAVMLLVAVGLGLLLAGARPPSWALVAAEVTAATIGSLVADRLGLRPAGPFFGIFALGSIASIPADRMEPVGALAVCAATALLCLAIGAAGAVATSVPWRRAEASGVATVAEPRLSTTAQLVHATRYALAVLLAGGFGVLLGADHANWAMASAAVPIAAVNAHDRINVELGIVVRRGVHRVAGTAAGLVLTALLLLPRPGESVLALAVIALLFPTELFMSRHYGVALGFFTPLIMLMTELAHPSEPLALITDRAIDTVFGVASGIAVVIAVRSRRSQESWERKDTTDGE